MVFLRASLIAVGITTLVASTTAVDIPTLSLFGEANRTAIFDGIKAVVAAAPRLYSYCGADITGGDIFVKRYPSPDDCVTNCLPSTGCNAGTWTRFDGGTCYFKRLGDSVTVNSNLAPNAGAVSFLRTEDAPPSEVPYPVFDVDMPGNDMGTYSVGPAVSGIPRCVGLCKDNARCSGYSWSSYNGGTCWLKSKSSSYVASRGTVSGLVGHARNAAACLAFM